MVTSGIVALVIAAIAMTSETPNHPVDGARKSTLASARPFGPTFVAVIRTLL